MAIPKIGTCPDFFSFWGCGQCCLGQRIGICTMDDHRDSIVGGDVDYLSFSNRSKRKLIIVETFIDLSISKTMQHFFSEPQTMISWAWVHSHQEDENVCTIMCNLPFRKRWRIFHYFTLEAAPCSILHMTYSHYRNTLTLWSSLDGAHHYTISLYSIPLIVKKTHRWIYFCHRCIEMDDERFVVISTYMKNPQYAYHRALCAWKRQQFDNALMAGCQYVMSSILYKGMVVTYTLRSWFERVMKM